MSLTPAWTYIIESKSIGKFVTEEKGIPYLSVETDYSADELPAESGARKTNQDSLQL